MTALAANGKVTVRFRLAGAFENGEMVEVATARGGSGVEDEVVLVGVQADQLLGELDIEGLEGQAVWARDEARLGQLLGSIRKAEQARVERSKPVDIIDGREVA